MIPIGFALAWAGYAVGFWGRALLKGWDLSFGQIASPRGYYQGSWPPPMASNDVIFPTGKASATAKTTSKTKTGG